MKLRDRCGHIALLIRPQRLMLSEKQGELLT